MSKIQSSGENITINADGANNDIKFQSNGSEVASIDQAGVMTATSFAGSGASLTALPAANLTGTITSGVQDNITRLGTVTSGALASGVHGKYVLEDQSHFRYGSETNSSSTSQTALNISGSNYATIATGSSTSDLLSFESVFGSLYTSTANSYIGIGLQKATNTGFSSGVATLWNSGEHAFGHSGDPSNNYHSYTGLTRTRTVSEWGLAASTTYYFRLIGMTHSTAASYVWGASGANITGDGLGVSLMATRWRLL
jgi:hypothetical protein